MEVVATVMVIVFENIKPCGQNPCHQQKCFHMHNSHITVTKPPLDQSHEASAVLGLVDS